MIEVEKKFTATEDDIKRIEKHSEFVGELVNKDTYYDRGGFPLVKNNMFLRKRNGAFELKVYVAEEGSEVDQYLELEKEEEIKNKLNIPAGKGISDYLEENEYVPFGSWETKRRRFKTGEFTIDVDSVDFGDFGYSVLEIEVMVRNKEDAEEATKKILSFAEELGLERGVHNGKALEFIKRTNPTAYEEIRATWDK